jgi:hypothetical protein
MSALEANCNGGTLHSGVSTAIGAAIHFLTNLNLNRVCDAPSHTYGRSEFHIHSVLL